MTRLWLAIAGCGGLCSVAAGAGAAHLGADGHAAELMRTGAIYGITHAAALLAVIASGGRDRALLASGWAFALGIPLFSGSLFALALSGIAGFGWLTPAGGAALMVGWAALALAALRRR